MGFASGQNSRGVFILSLHLTKNLQVMLRKRQMGFYRSQKFASSKVLSVLYEMMLII